MTMVLTWQGSEVRQVEVTDGTVRVRLSVASARRVDSAHPDQGEEGFLGPLTVVFIHAKVRGDLGSALGTLADGTLSHAGHTHRHLALPFSWAPDIHAELAFRNGTVLHIEAEAVSCSPGTESRFHESMAC